MLPWSTGLEHDVNSEDFFRRRSGQDGEVLEGRALLLRGNRQFHRKIDRAIFSDSFLQELRFFCVY